MLRPRTSRLSGVTVLLVTAATHTTAQDQVRTLQFPEDGVIAVVQGHVNGVALMLGHDSSGLAGWAARFDPAMVLEWLPDARAVVGYVQPPDNPYVMTPTLPTLGPGMIALLRKREGDGWDETEIVYQPHPDSQAVTTAIGQTAAGLLLDLIGLQASASAWIPPDPDDRDRILPEDHSFDIPVRRLRMPDAEYPRSMYGERRAGTVWISGVVGTDGRVVGSSIVILYATDPAFTAGAASIVRAAEFQPAEVGGHPVPVNIFQTIDYRPCAECRRKDR